ncbi:MAG: hypothetical protein M9907_19265 [Burkholderiaceae bacterium]|nr:hypothetical protein [Burkholderiaceae bacterium]
MNDDNNLSPLTAAAMALLECGEMFKAIRAANENGGDTLTLANIGERIASEAYEAFEAYEAGATG